MYKVVSVINLGDGDYRASAIVYYGQAEVIYEKGKWSYPPNWLASFGHGICVFEKLDQARAFARSECIWRRTEIWEVECEDPMPTPIFCNVESLSNGELVAIGIPWEFPDGSKFFGRIKLIRPVYEYSSDPEECEITEIELEWTT